jgi:flagellar protein FliS
MTRANSPTSASGANPYATQAILTAPPSTLVVRLYEGAIHQLRKAIRCIEANDIKGRYTANRRAFDIIEHLMCTLNLEKGGQIADNLAQLYRYMMRRLIDVDVQNSAQAAEDVIALLDPLYQAWRKLDQEIASRPGQGERPPDQAESIQSVA